LCQALFERRHASLPFRVVRGRSHEHADPPRSLALLCAGGERPCGCCAAKPSNEIPPPHVLPKQGRDIVAVHSSILKEARCPLWVDNVEKGLVIFGEQ